MTEVGKLGATLVDVKAFECLHNSDEEFDRLRGEIAEAFSGQSEETVKAWVDEAVKAQRMRPTNA